MRIVMSYDIKSQLKEEIKMYDFQKANTWKRISAYLCDFILLAILVVGLAFLLTTVLGYDTYYERLEASYDKYEAEFGVSFDATAAELAEMSDDERALFESATKALSNDSDVQYTLGMLFNLTLIIITFSILLAYLLLEFVVPLLFGNGQTLGKKVFGVGVMCEDGVKISAVQLFARTVLGKYTIETMLPVLIVIMIFFGVMGIFGTFVIIALLIAQIVIFAVTKTNSVIHDKLARTVTVDMASQMIFESPEALLAYKKRIHEEQAQSSADDGRLVK